MEVKINKEIRNYTESMFFGLSLRQFIFSVLACISLFSFSISLVLVSCLSAFSVLSSTLFHRLQWLASPFHNKDYLAGTSAFSASEILI